jgi:thiosulfate/3-mercaptopyruvate sulfurtransferase
LDVIVVSTAAVDPVDPIELPSALVSADWLGSQLGAPGLVVLDCTVQYRPDGQGGTARVSGRADYLTVGHVPGAVFADLLAELSDPAGAYPFSRPSAEAFAAAMGELGVGPDSTVVVYDDSAGFWATRVWWLLRAHGFDRAALLDGGLTAWRAAGHSLETTAVRSIPTVFVSDPRPELFVDREQVLDAVHGARPATLINALPADDFSGAASPRSRPGHIPGSLSLPVAALTSAAGGLRPVAELTMVVDEALGRPADAGELIAYCGGGISATLDAFVLTLLGYPDVTVYDGSLNEWAADPALPLET